MNRKKGQEVPAELLTALVELPPDKLECVKLDAMAQAIGTSRDTVKRQFKALRALGYARWSRHGRNGLHVVIDWMMVRRFQTERVVFIREDRV